MFSDQGARDGRQLFLQLATTISGSELQGCPGESLAGKGCVKTSLAAQRVAPEPRRAAGADEVCNQIDVVALDAPASEWHRTWMAREQARRPADLGALLRALPGPPDGSGKWLEAFVRLEKLETWPHDPRLSAALVEVLEQRPVTSPRAEPFYRLARTMIVRLGDARALERFASSAELRAARGPASTLPLRLAPRSLDHEEMISGLEQALAGAPLELSSEEEGLIRALLAVCRPPGPDLADLLAGVYADPADDGARAAYAAALVARGETRGEYVLLELRSHAGEVLSPAEQARAESLLSAHVQAWLGDLALLVGSGCVRFERGLSASTEIRRDLSSPT
ncbi:MAG: hypothetical protein HY908_30935 [Myxococcales bacterium]|nr:hypothetical protein [Myxococcales bacterium]